MRYHTVSNLIGGEPPDGLSSLVHQDVDLHTARRETHQPPAQVVRAELSKRVADRPLWQGTRGGNSGHAVVVSRHLVLSGVVPSARLCEAYAKSGGGYANAAAKGCSDF